MFSSGNMLRISKRPSLVDNEWSCDSKWAKCTRDDIFWEIAGGADLWETNSLGRTPLMLACSYSKKPDVLDCLLEQLDEQGVKAKTRSGWTALHFLTNNNLDHMNAVMMAQKLLIAGADPTEATDQRQSALSFAKRSRDISAPGVVRLLEKWVREGGPDVNYRIEKQWRKASLAATIKPKSGVVGMLAAAKAAADIAAVAAVSLPGR